MDEQNSRDRVTYLRKLAIDSLNNYQGGFDELEQLDRDLKSIIRSMSDVTDSAWTKLSVRNWGQLGVYASKALNDGRLLLTQDEEADVRMIVTELIEELQDHNLANFTDRDEER